MAFITRKEEGNKIIKDRFMTPDGNVGYFYNLEETITYKLFGLIPIYKTCTEYQWTGNTDIQSFRESLDNKSGIGFAQN